MAILGENHKEQPNCCVCGGSRHEFVRKVFDDRYGLPEVFSLVSCSHCRHVMTAPAMLEKDLPDLYRRYYPRKHIDTSAIIAEASHVAGWRSSLRRWWWGTDNQGQYGVSAGQTVLDVGCGSGLSLVEAEVLGADAYGIEADPNVHAVVDELGLKIHIGNLLDDPFPGVGFDLIVLNQVIEHIPDPGILLETLKKRLRPEGRIVLSLPHRRSIWRRLSGDRWINWHIPFHLHHFDKKGIRALAEHHGFSIIRLRTITPTLWTVLQFQAMRQTPVRGVPATLWGGQQPSPSSGSEDDRQAKPDAGMPARALRKLVRLSGLFALSLLNRIVDLAGQGDSILLELRIGKGA